MLDSVDRLTLFNLVATVDAFIGAGVSPEELLGMLDAALPGEDDEVQMLNAALGLAARGGHAEVAAALLDARACPDAWQSKKKRGEAPLMLAAGGGR